VITKLIAKNWLCNDHAEVSRATAAVKITAETPVTPSDAAEFPGAGGTASPAGDAAVAEGAGVEDGGAAVLEGGRVVTGDGVAALGGGLEVEGTRVMAPICGEAAEDDGVEAEGG